MTSPPLSVQPPRFAFWLVNLFTIPGDAEAIMGDLLEEFSYLACKSGAAYARHWYWRQALKTIAHLIYSAYRTAPWSTSAAVGGFLLPKLISGVLRFTEQAIFAVLVRYQVPEHHFNTYVFFASTGIDIATVIVFLCVGCGVALLARRREMAAATTLSLIHVAMVIVGSLVNLSRTGHYPGLLMLTWYFADSFAILIGAAIVRSYRSARHIGSNHGLEKPAL